MTTEESVVPDDALLRRVPDQTPSMWKQDEEGIRPTSAAMKPSQRDAGLSVDIRRLLPDPAQPTTVLAEFPTHGLAEFRASVPIGLGLEVHHAPQDDNAAHANVVGFDGFSKSQAKRLQKRLAEAAVWIQMPAGALEAS